MSIEAAIGRIDQIVGLQQQLLDPSGATTSATTNASTAATASPSTSVLAGAAGIGGAYGTGGTDAASAASAADFANELASATQASSASALGSSDADTATSTPSLGESDDSSLLSLLSSLTTSDDSAATTTDPAAQGELTGTIDPTAQGELTGTTDPTAEGELTGTTDPTAYAAAATDVVPATATTAVEASSPSDPRITAMTQEADSLVGEPYVFGGGHDNFGPQSGYDCSGFVSAVLHAGGYLSSPQDTVSLPSAPGIESGPGRYVTIYDRSQPGAEGHVIIDIDGQFYESGGESASWGGGGGVEKIGTPSAAYLSTFNDVLHPAGL